MSDLTFRDMLYGEIHLPGWLESFLRLPELVRLRGVRLSNVDSIDYKDFGSANRYDHAIGVAHLANIVATRRRMDPHDTAVLILAALLHDVGTPPFGHTLELIYDDLDHEQEAWKALGISADIAGASVGGWRGEFPQFVKRCGTLNDLLKAKIDPYEVGEVIVGGGDYGYLINGTIDLDNADNVIRGAHYLGLDAHGSLAEQIAHWLADQEAPPVELGSVKFEAVRKWLRLQNEYYRFFFETSTEETARQAHLQFLAREAKRLGIARERLTRSTDEEFLNNIQHFAESMNTPDGEILFDQVRKYRAMELPTLVHTVDVDSSRDVRVLNLRAAISWMERKLRRRGFIPALFFSKRRYKSDLTDNLSLFEPPLARLYIFALYKPKAERLTTEALSSNIILGVGARGQVRSLQQEFARNLTNWLIEKPWLRLDDAANVSIIESLKSWGDWSFISSKNESLHSYPSTFVHAIPSSLIRSLRLSGLRILDPFCGTSQTGLAAIKAGASVICADTNEVALMISRGRFTYHSEERRLALRSIKPSELKDSVPSAAPQVKDLYKWHHPDTVSALCSIKGYIEALDNRELSAFLTLCFSAILTNTTARRGKQHGWFADNTPLPLGQDAPPFYDPYALFCDRIERNLRILERDYATLQRLGIDPADAYSTVDIRRVNASTATTADYGIEQGQLNAIITSPPYLCMSDYTLGQRLSYYWLFPQDLDTDFNEEIGARRRRTNSAEAHRQYLHDMQSFARMASEAITDDGFVAIVVGSPQAKAFAESSIYQEIDEAFCHAGLSLLWSTSRPVTWHRNHGYERLKRERVSVYKKC